MCFQNNMCAESTLSEFVISLALVNTCEPVNEETESRNFSDLEVQPLQMAIKKKNNHPCSNILPAYIKGHLRFD